MTTQDQALIPSLVSQKKINLWIQSLIIAGGVAWLSLLAQISIPVPGSPVPITGQTFGVAFMALTWGRKRGLIVMSSYLTLGFLGLPVFAQGNSGFLIGPTFGYLIGMLIASYVMGSLADRGWTQTFAKSWLAAFTGSMITFSCGLFVLSFFIPSSHLIAAGLIPFLPGDFVKTLSVSVLANKTRTRFQ